MTLYSTGLFNLMQESWFDRCSSQSTTWIKEMAGDLGLPVLGTLYHTWKHHLNSCELTDIVLESLASSVNEEVSAATVPSIYVASSCD